MLEIMKTKKERTTLFNGSPNENCDIIIQRKKEVIKHNEDGSYTVSYETENVNITAKVNESKKLIKNATAVEKLKEIEKVFTEVTK